MIRIEPDQRIGGKGQLETAAGIDRPGWACRLIEGD